MRSPIVVMGISGCGKSTVGAALAQRLSVPFADADDLHPPSNLAKMTAGRPLDDDDRWPWLDTVGEWLARHPGGCVMSCSALKRAYRDRLRSHQPSTWFLHLAGSADLIAERQAHRPGHFMPPALFASQVATLEPLESDESGMVIDVGRGVGDIVDETVRLLR
ncbi:gluconokinase [Gordonia sp. NPDC003424]